MKQPSLPVALFLAILPLVVVGAYLCVREFTHQTEVALERRESIADLSATLVHEKFKGVVDLGMSLASRPLVYGNIEKNDWDEALSVIENVPRDFPYIDSIGFLDPAGIAKATAPSISEVIGKSFTHRDYYQGVSKEWEPYVSEAFRRTAEPKYNVVTVAVPIKSLEQKVLGILLLTIKLDVITEWTKSVDTGPGALLFIVDRNGQLISHNHLRPEDDLISYSGLPSIQKVLQGAQGVEVHEADSIIEEKHVAAYAPVKEYGFGVEVAQSTHIAFAERNKEVVVLAVIWVFVVGVIGFSFYLILKSRAKIKEQRDRERVLLSGIGDGIVAIDRQWRIVLWNKAASVITGWSEAEVLGQPFRAIVKLIRENDRKENIAFIEDAIVMGMPSSLEIGTLLVKKDGSEIAVGDSAAPIIDQTGDTKGAIIVFRDASKERETMHMRSEFVYASHQLRTPITEALWNLDLAKKEEDQTKRVESLEIVENSLMSIQRLSEHLVAVSEIDQGTISSKKSTIKIVDVLNEVQSLLDEEAKKRNVTISFGPVSVMAAFDTDAKLFKKALYEIVENAILYSPAGSGVTINTIMKEKDMVIEVVDTGVGIPETEQPVIFTKFFRASNRPKDVAGGGLGLYIAKAYITYLGGKIWLESTEGKGTTFYISLPLA